MKEFDFIPLENIVKTPGLVGKTIETKGIARGVTVKIGLIRANKLRY